MSERSIFVEALEKDSPDQRAAYLDEACASDAALRQRLDRATAWDMDENPVVHTTAVKPSEIVNVDAMRFAPLALATAAT